MVDRYILERVADRKILDLDLPIDVSATGRKLSGAGAFSGSMLPARYEPEVVPFGSLIHWEQSGIIRGSYLVTRCAWKGDRWQVEGVGFSGYLAGLVYEAEREWVRVDPISIIRHIWEHAQSRTGGDLGVKVVGSSKYTIGEPKRDVSFTTGSGEQVDFEAGPYHLRWWDTPDLAKAASDLAAAAHSEFVEWSSWNAERTRIDKEIRYRPHVGSRLDVQFSDDVNVVDSVDVVADGTEYANVVIVLGAGEGAKARRVTLAAPDGRLRRVKVIDAKNVTSKEVLETTARAELRRAQRGETVEAIEVLDHPTARFGTYQPGDEVLVEVLSSRGKQISQWSRLLEIEEDGDRAKLALEAI